MCRQSLLCQSGHSSRVSCATWASVSPSACHRVPSQLECVFPFVCVFVFVCVGRGVAAHDEPLVPAANTIVLSMPYPLSHRGPHTNRHTHTHTHTHTNTHSLSLSLALSKSVHLVPTSASFSRVDPSLLENITDRKRHKELRGRKREFD